MNKSWDKLVSISTECGISATFDLQSYREINTKTKQLVDRYIDQQSKSLSNQYHFPEAIRQICTVFYTPLPQKDLKDCSYDSVDGEKLWNNVEEWTKGMKSEHVPSRALAMANICKVIQLEIDDDPFFEMPRMQQLIKSGISDQAIELVSTLAMQEDADTNSIHQCLFILESMVSYLPEYSKDISEKLVFSLVHLLLTSKSLLLKNQAINILQSAFDESLGITQSIQQQLSPHFASICALNGDHFDEDGGDEHSICNNSKKRGVLFLYSVAYILSCFELSDHIMCIQRKNMRRNLLKFVSDAFIFLQSLNSECYETEIKEIRQWLKQTLLSLKTVLMNKRRI